jgi:hypothetical protein
VAVQLEVPAQAWVMCEAVRLSRCWSTCCATRWTRCRARPRPVASR